LENEIREKSFFPLDFFQTWATVKVFLFNLNPKKGKK